MRQFSFDTTFGVDELASASSQLLNAGMAVSNLQGSLKTLGDLAQGDKVKFQELTSIFAKIQNTGRATSMQLQQLALRGIPIQKTLKEMGVVGSASAEQLTKAFQKLTEEGGQFHNAMDNIIDTIEGKRGFITDTLKEINVNFGELTGLTDAYKNGLDLLYNILNAVNNDLMAINENPLMKALLRGAILGALTALAGVIAVSIIPKLIQVIAHLTTINLLSGPAGWAVLAVAGITAVAVGMATFSKETEKAKNEQLKLADAIKEAKKAEEMDFNFRMNGLTPTSGSRNADLERKTNTLTAYQKVLADFEKDLAEQKQQEAYFLEEYRKGSYGALEDEGLKEARRNIDDISAKIARARKLVEEQSELVDEVQKKVNDVNALQPMREAFGELADSILPKNKKELADIEAKYQAIVDYETQLKELNGWLNNEGTEYIKYDEAKSEIDRVKDYFQKQLNDLKLQIRIDETATDWQKELQSMFGFDNETMRKLMDKELAKGGGTIIDDYINNLANRRNQRIHSDALMGINGAKGTKGYLEDDIKNLVSIYEKLMESPAIFGYDKNSNGLDNTTQSIKDNLNLLWNEFKTAGGTLEEFRELTGNANLALEELEETIKYNLIDTITEYAKNSVQGTDVGTFITAMENGAPPLVALIEVLVKDLIDVIGGNERVKYMLDGIKHLLEAFAPLLEAIINLLTFVELIIRPLLKLINDGLKAIFGNFNKWFDDFYSSWEIEDDKKKEKEKDLTNQYEALLKAIKDQEEYYIRKKMELNMLALDDRVTKVNDMILSPHGTFSTNPQDTIIATKNPQGLGGTVNNIKVINNAGAQVDVQERKGNGMNEILVTISKKIASDVANGYNGWDGAFAMQQQRVSGRRL